MSSSSSPLRGVLLDIEGTTSSVRFVYDVMFPYARRELHAYLTEAWETDECRAACEQLAHEAGRESLDAWSEAENAPAMTLVEREVAQLMDADVKATGLKQIQGLIWRAGFKSGQLVAHVYADVPPALKAWREGGLDLRIYSSGSREAQHQFFGHTEQGDLLPLLSGHYDTHIGAKREADSYRRIAEDWALAPGALLFLSDITEELDAAREAGYRTGLMLRPENAAQEADHGHAEYHDFNQVPALT